MIAFAFSVIPEGERTECVYGASKQFDSPSDKGKPVARPGTQSLGFSCRSAQTTEEERHRLVMAGHVAFGGSCDASDAFVPFVVP